MDKFKDRYVLGEGYPWTDKNLKRWMCIRKCIPYTYGKELDWPKEFWDFDVPKYRLILERVK